jgi:hypothetical protein
MAEVNSPIEQKIFSSLYVDRLYREVIESKNVSNYKKEIFPYEEIYPKGGTSIHLDQEKSLLVPEGTNTKDIENCKTIYSAFKLLTPTQASDPRLWTYLTHVTYWNYMKSRWPVNKAKNPVNRIRDRYFLRTLNLQALTRNGISRLWWYGYLTYDGNRKNPWELTETLLSRADLVVGITERALGCNKNILTALLDFFNENPEIRESEMSSRKLLKKLNLVGGVKNLPFLDSTEIKEILNNVKD